MIVGLDSAMPPTAAQAQAARAAGIRLWSGYIQTKPNVGLYHAWSLADFENARLCGGTPIAFCSGFDDPLACRDKAAQWRVRLCLDVESGIRPDGPWVQAWLNISGAGLYGTKNAHTGRNAKFHIAAWYLGDPHASYPAGWAGTAPHGWQWQNTHTEFGVGVDRGWYDDWFANGGTSQMKLDQAIALGHVMSLMAFRAPMNAARQAELTNEFNAGHAMGDLFARWYGEGQTAGTAYPQAGPKLGSFDATITPK